MVEQNRLIALAEAGCVRCVVGKLGKCPVGKQLMRLRTHGTDHGLNNMGPPTKLISGHLHVWLGTLTRVLVDIVHLDLLLFVVRSGIVNLFVYFHCFRCVWLLATLLLSRLITLFVTEL